METPIEPSVPSSPSVSQKKLPLKHKVEAILFATGSRMSVADITRLARSREESVREALQELKQKYSNQENSITLTEDGEFWKLGVGDHYLPVVKKIVTETELSKTVLETLAIIAFKYPIKQSDLIHIRTNKAYDHLKELEQLGFISRKKHGRTNLIKLSEKFFQYFDLPEEKLKQHLADFESIAHAIGQREAELHERKALRSKELEEMKSKDEDIQKAIDTLDEPSKESEQPAQAHPSLSPQLEPYGSKEQDEAEQKVEIGVYEVPPEESAKESVPLKDFTAEKMQTPKHIPAPIAKQQEMVQESNIKEQDELETASQEPLEQQTAEQKPTEEETLPETHFEGVGIMPTLEQEKQIEDKVEKLLHPPKERESEPAITPDEDELEEDLNRARKRRHAAED